MNPSMHQQSFFWSIAGAVLGGFAWLAATGMVIGKPLICAAAAVVAVATLAAGRVLGRRYPERLFSVTGLLIIWVVIANLVFIPLVYDDIPATVGGMTTGKEVFSEAGLMALLAAFSLLGFFFVIRDMGSKKSGQKQT